VPDASHSLRSLQERVALFDRARGWQVVNETHTALHILEELGEVARELLHLAGYKAPDPDAGGRLSGELADLTLLLLKLATSRGIDLEAAVAAKLEENERRFPLEESRAAIATYLERQEP
jgi:NTP pyrophosphatase (non-canonical NTP hydrolase)